MKPVLSLITDRRRLDPPGEDALVARVAAAAAAGVHLVQVRERDIEAGALLQLVRRCVEAVAGRARVLVNDRLDVALAAGAHGVHLRGDSMPAQRVRRMVPSGFIIGRSVHSLDEVRRDDGCADYLLFGTVFQTMSKPGRPGAGIALLRDAVVASPVPVLALGGVTLARAATVAATGAAGVAAIGLFGDAAESQLPGLVAQLDAAFDGATGGC